MTGTAVGGVLLTGGRSRRLGTDKAGLRYRGETLAGRAARLLLAHCAPVVEVGAGVSGLPAVREEPAGAGPLAALLAGVDALRARGHEGPVLLLACDLVHADQVVAGVLAAPRGPTVLPVDEAGRAQYVCARWSEAAIARAGELRCGGARSLRAVADALGPDDCVRLEGFPPDAFADVDTPEDATRLGVEVPR